VFIEVGTECLNVIMCSLHDVDKMNAFRAGHVSLSVRVCVCLYDARREPLDGF
jgi:hypothetical protein